MNKNTMSFYCVYIKTKNKFDKYIKLNKIKNKYIIDVHKIIEDEGIDITKEKPFLKIIIFQKIKQAIDKNKDIYYIPDFEDDFSIEKLLNIKKILGENNDFNVLVFYNEFKKDTDLINDIYQNISKFSQSFIIKDF